MHISIYLPQIFGLYISLQSIGSCLLPLANTCSTLPTSFKKNSKYIFQFHDHWFRLLIVNHSKKCWLDFCTIDWPLASSYYSICIFHMTSFDNISLLLFIFARILYVWRSSNWKLAMCNSSKFIESCAHTYSHLTIVGAFWFLNC